MSREERNWVQMNFWSFRSLTEPRKALFLRSDDAEIAESLVNDLAAVGLVGVDDVFTRVFECVECGSVVIAPQFRFRAGRSFRFDDSRLHSYIPSFFEPCRHCGYKNDATENEVVCQGLERSVP